MGAPPALSRQQEHDEIVLDVPTGSSTNSIADLLEKKAVIGNAFLFKLYVRWKRERDHFKASRYRLPEHAQADEVVHTLKAGPLPPRPSS